MPLLDSRGVVESLFTESPKFHGAAGEHSWPLGADVLWWLFDSLRPTDATLETGCGYSTIIFALKGTWHTVISPTSHEHKLIRDWSAAHDVNLSRITFLAERSESALPALNEGNLDLVLIDGFHAFPVPMVDWFYTSRLLATGGLVVIDDTQIRTCRILCDFLRAEKGRWTSYENSATQMFFDGWMLHYLMKTGNLSRGHLRPTAIYPCRTYDVVAVAPSTGADALGFA